MIENIDRETFGLVLFIYLFFSINSRTGSESSIFSIFIQIAFTRRQLSRFHSFASLPFTSFEGDPRHFLSLTIRVEIPMYRMRNSSIIASSGIMRFTV